jgi:GDPmannose 4,6-dehydratase
MLSEEIKMEKTALITGINGQAGSYLAEELLREGYKVDGIIRRSANPNFCNISGILNKITLHEADITDQQSLIPIIKKRYTHIFNAAAQSHVATSFQQPTLTMQVTGIGVLNLLETIREHSPESRFLQFSSSEMFGDQYDHFEKVYCPGGYCFGNKVKNTGLFEQPFREELLAQDEKTMMNPQSPYGIAKLAAYNYTRLYRQSYGLFASNVIMFNYESPRRGAKFVTKKITNYVKNLTKDEIYLGQIAWSNKHTQNSKIYPSIQQVGLRPNLQLGNLDAMRDWGYCPDYMRGCRMVLEHTVPEDYVLATGETHTVKEFADEAFNAVGLHSSEFVQIDESLKRPSEVSYLCGNAEKIKKDIGWEPTVKFKELVKIMVENG